MNKFRNIISLLSLCIFFLLNFSSQVFGEENGIFSGSVVDVVQKPVSGVEVFVYNSSNTRRPADYISAPTNNNGEFQVTLPPGTYWVMARLRHGEERFGPLAPGDKHSGSPMEIDIAAGENVQEEFVVVDLDETSQLIVKTDTSFIKIEGILSNKKGEPVKNGYVYVNNSPARKKIPDYVSAWTGKNGKYVIFLPEGTYYFASGKKFPPGPEFAYFKQVTIDSSTKNINIITEY